ncbi:hypothetical protein QN277_000980 [Acacia crassicarpa]|uniref:Uncharacterized protein n=1 Tax=Acacia crassicarpa TaxID=499986 RepID=A0AAE1N7L2_9FABA|nr:hypothetical protein QN277_000980 [Acacia crassicarpa]
MKASPRDPRFSRYNLFTKELFKQHDERPMEKQKQKGKGKNTNGGEKFFSEDLSIDMIEAWKKLSEKEKGEYTKQAQQLSAPTKAKKYLVLFLTRCAPNTFMQVCNNLKDRPEVMARLKAIRFDRLMRISC